MNVAGPSKIASTTTVNPYQPPLNAKNQKIKFTSADPFSSQFVETHLRKSRNLDAKALYENRVKGKHLILENPAKESRLKKELAEKKARRAKHREQKKLGVMGRKEAAFNGLWTLEKEQTKYELFVPLHQLWLGYMSELLGLWKPPSALSSKPPSLPNSSAMHAKLVKADFHGSIMFVKHSKNPCLVGITGIVLHETENAFRIITKKNELKLLPKQNSIFSFRIPLYDTRSLLGGTSEIPESIPQMEFELYGNQFRFRSADRASKKFKAKETIEL